MIRINVDRNVSIANYRNLPEDVFGVASHFLHTSMFYTIQGEGPFSGEPALFLRLAGCNIGAKDDCPWCDTKFNFDEGKHINFKEVEIEMAKHKTTLLVITGGEPLLQHKAIVAFAERNPFLHVQVETNGMLLREDNISQDITYVVSPKIPHGTGMYRPIPEFMFGNVAFKFVVDADPASPYHGLPEQLFDEATPTSNVFISGITVYTGPSAPGVVQSLWANNIDREKTAQNYAYAAAIAMNHGFCWSLQSHLLAGVE